MSQNWWHLWWRYRLLYQNPEYSIQRKVVLAILCNSITLSCASNLLSIGKAAFSTARRHYRCLSTVTQITKTVRSMQRYNRDCVFWAIEFILSPTNIKILSWGTKKIISDGKEVDFSWFMTLKKQEYIYCDYIEAYRVDERVLHGSFAKLVKALTIFDQKALCFRNPSMWSSSVFERDHKYNFSECNISNCIENDFQAWAFHEVWFYST